MSDYDADFTDVQIFSNLFSSNSLEWRILSRSHRPMDSIEWNHCEKSTTLGRANIFFLGMRSSSMIGWFLQCLKEENDDQH